MERPSFPFFLLLLTFFFLSSSVVSAIGISPNQLPQEGASKSIGQQQQQQQKIPDTYMRNRFISNVAAPAPAPAPADPPVTNVQQPIKQPQRSISGGATEDDSTAIAGSITKRVANGKQYALLAMHRVRKGQPNPAAQNIVKENIGLTSLEEPNYRLNSEGETMDLPPAPPAPPTPPVENIGKREQGAMARAFLDLHNKLRLPMNLPPLAWDKNLTHYARQWASQVAATGDCSPKHSDGPYGENVFWGGGSDWKPTDAVGAWSEEQPFYNMNNNTCAEGKECGHYTQLMWKSSLKLGCARSQCPSTDTFIICSYDPPGNYIGESPFA